MGGIAVNHRNGERRRRYVTAAGSTPYTSIDAERLEDAIRKAVKAAFGSAVIHLRNADDQSEALKAEVEEAEAELRSFSLDLSARKALGAELWHDEALDARKAALTAAQDGYRAELARNAATSTPPAADSLDDDANLRRALLAMAEAIVISPGRGSVADRTRIVWKFDAGHEAVAA